MEDTADLKRSTDRTAAPTPLGQAPRLSKQTPGANAPGFVVVGAKRPGDQAWDCSFNLSPSINQRVH